MKQNEKLINLSIAVFSGHNNQKYTTREWKGEQARERERDVKVPGGNENKYNMFVYNYKSPNIVREEWKKQRKVFLKSVHRSDVNNGNNSSKQ